MIRLTVINLTNSPFDLEGGTRLPAMGRVTESFDDGYANALRQSPGLEVHDADPLDHDSYGVKGGSKSVAEGGLDDLRAEADALGIAVDRRWGDKRLLAEIGKAGRAE